MGFSSLFPPCPQWWYRDEGLLGSSVIRYARLLARPARLLTVTTERSDPFPLSSYRNILSYFSGLIFLVRFSDLYFYFKRQRYFNFHLRERKEEGNRK